MTFSEITTFLSAVQCSAVTSSAVQCSAVVESEVANIMVII